MVVKTQGMVSGPSPEAGSGRRVAARVGLMCVLAIVMFAVRTSANNAGASSSPVATPLPKATAPKEAAAPTIVGSAACKGCHQQQAHEFGATMMGKIFLGGNARDEAERQGCETCHGPGSLYVKDMAQAMGQGHKSGETGHLPTNHGLITFRRDSGEAVAKDNAVCLSCHENGERAFWPASTHALRGLACTDCHTVMQQLSPRFQLSARERVTPFLVFRPETYVCLRCHLRRKMQMNLPAHMPLREGEMTCVDCHNPHGGPYPYQLKEATIDEVCYDCHAEKRGPFLWTHPPVIQNCDNCHEPHGTVNRFLLKVRPPRLCQQCHIGRFHPGVPNGPRTIFVINRACLNCHSMIHGSNAPGGRVFTR